MKQHQDVMRDILRTGDVKTDRTGTGTISKFGGQMKFSLQHGIWPIPTTREVEHEKISSELEWMIKGIVSVQWLKDRANNIWNSWMGEQSGTIGPMYGEQWRNWNASGGLTKEVLTNVIAKAAENVGPGAWEFPVGQEQFNESFFQQLDEITKPYEQGGRGGTDQLQYVINELKNNPDSRRICVNVWHAGLLPVNNISPKENADAGRMALAPCHSMWQVNTAPLTDIEILQQVAYREEAFLPQLDQAMAMHGVRTSTEVQEYISMQTNVWMKEQGWLAIEANKQYNFAISRDLPISESGQAIIRAYKEMGRPTRKLSLMCYARSQDVPLGTVFNVGMYSLLAHVLAQQTGMVPWEYTHAMGDYHIYANQVEKAELQLSRDPMRPAHVIVDPWLDAIDNFDHRKLTVLYKAHPKIVYPRAAV